MKLPNLLAAALAASCLLGASAAHAVPSTVSFTARITTDDGTPVEGNVALVLRVYDAATDGALLWEETQPSVPAEEGLVYASLGSIDPVNNGLDATVFTGSAAYLELTVDGDTLSPRIPIESVPYAINAGRADVAAALEGFDPATVQQRVTGVCNAGMYVTAVNADGTVSCGTDANSGGDITGVTAGAGLSGGGGSGGVTLSVNTTAIQARVTGVCNTGMYVTAVNQDGTVACAADANAGGDITGVTAGAGLTGGGNSGGVTLTVNTAAIQARVTGACNTGMFITAVNQDGTVQCANDANAGGDITGVTAGAGLTGGGTSGGVTLTVNTAVVQARVAGVCGAGMYVMSVNQDGTVNCGTDANSGGDITGVTAGTGLSGGGATGGVTLSVNPAAVQTRVSGVCGAGMYVMSVNQDGSVNCGTDANSGGDITGITAGTGLTGGGTTGTPTIGIANNGVNTAQIAAGAVSMSKTSGPIGTLTQTALANMSNGSVTYNYDDAAVAMNDAGVCHVTAWSSGQGPSFQLRPAMLNVATNGTSLLSPRRGYSVSGGMEAHAVGTFSVAAGTSYRFGCYYQGFLSNQTVVNASCQTSWICN